MRSVKVMKVLSKSHTANRFIESCFQEFDQKNLNSFLSFDICCSQNEVKLTSRSFWSSSYFTIETCMYETFNFNEPFCEQSARGIFYSFADDVWLRFCLLVNVGIFFIFAFNFMPARLKILLLNQASEHLSTVCKWSSSGAVTILHPRHFYDVYHVLFRSANRIPVFFWSFLKRK